MKLRHLAAIAISNVDKKSVEGQTPVRLCNYLDVYKNPKIGPDHEFTAATATPDQIRQFRLRAGDVLVTKDSETPNDIGVPAYVTSDFSDVLCGYHLAILRPRKSLIDSRYLYWALAAEPARSQFTAFALGITRFGLRLDSISNVTVAVPNLRAQRAIADFLDDQTSQHNRSVEANLRLQARLRERRETITALGVSGLLIGLTTSKSRVPWLDTHPPGWLVVKLTLIARLGSGHTPSRLHPEWWQEASIPWITTGEVHQMRDDRIEYVSETRECISELGLANSSAQLHPAGTVVLCRTASAGFSAIMGLPMATSQDFVTWTCGPQLRPRYLLLCLRAMRQDLLGRLAMGSTHQTIYVPDVESIRVPLPPVAQQDQIVEDTWSKLKKVDELLDHLAHEIELFQERRQALITAAVTGEIPVPGAA